MPEQSASIASRLLARMVAAHERGEHEGHNDILCPQCPYIVHLATPRLRW